MGGALKRLDAGKPGTRPVHPDFGAALGGNPYVIEGVIFRPYRYGVNAYVRFDDGHRIGLWNNHRHSTYRVSVDGEYLPRTFRKFETAARAGIKASVLQS